MPEEARDEQPIDVTITEYLTNTERFDVSEEMEEDDIIEEEAAEKIEENLDPEVNKAVEIKPEEVKEAKEEESEPDEKLDE